jgi:hypothetical protein
LTAAWLILPALVSQPPAGRPDNYIGAVGSRLHFEAAVQPSAFTLNESFTYTLRIVGAGDVSRLEAPDLSSQKNFRSKFEVVGPAVATSLPNGKAFAYPLRARSDEVLRVPALLFSVYDDSPPRPHYQTLRTPEVPITVVKAEAAKVERFDAPREPEADGGADLKWLFVAAGVGAVGAAIAIRYYGRTTGRGTGTAEAAEPAAPILSPDDPLKALAERFGLAPGQTTSNELYAGAKAAGIGEDRCEDLRVRLERIERAKFSRSPEDAEKLKLGLLNWLNDC